MLGIQHKEYQCPGPTHRKDFYSIGLEWAQALIFKKTQPNSMSECDVQPGLGTTALNSKIPLPNVMVAAHVLCY